MISARASGEAGVGDGVGASTVTRCAVSPGYFLDVDGGDRIGNMVTHLHKEGTTVVLCGCAGNGVEMLQSAEWLTCWSCQ